MRDSTAASRLERAVARLEVDLLNLSNLLGRLEALTGSFPMPGLAPSGPGQPPLDFDEHTQKFIDRRKDEKAQELEDRLDTLGEEDES